MKYLILIYGNPESRAIWESFSDAQRAEGLHEYSVLADMLKGSGELVVTEALADPSRAKTVHVRDGRTLSTDGPFAEAKEYLAGFFLVDCADEDRAVEIAGMVPEAAFGMVDVRPVIDKTELLDV